MGGESLLILNKILETSGGLEIMIMATKIFTFDCAHMLTGHKGLCKNVHGHTYKVEVTVENKAGLIADGPSEAMVMDFKDLKDICNGLFGSFDHAFIYNENQEGTDTAEGDIIKVIKLHGLKHVAFPGRPTAEEMSYYFAKHIQTRMNEISNYQFKVHEVKVWETPTSFASHTN